MANNRMYFVCMVCLAEETTTWEDCNTYIAKYSPRDGWGNEDDTRLGERIGGFFNKHIHRSMYGEHIALLYETSTPFGQEKRAIIESVIAATRKVQDGEIT